MGMLPKWFAPPVLNTKEQRRCCDASRDVLGRMPIGYCGPQCQGREERTRYLEYLKEHHQVIRRANFERRPRSVR